MKNWILPASLCLALAVPCLDVAYAAATPPSGRQQGVFNNAPAPTAADYRERLVHVRAAYLALDQAAVRQEIFGLLLGLGPEEGVGVFLALVEGALQEGEDGGLDGIESVLLYAVDGVYADGSASDVAMLEQLFVDYPNQFYVVDTPNTALILPLGRTSTGVFLDVRADAIRLLVDSVVQRGGMPHDGLDGLLDLADVRMGLCGLDVRQGTDRGMIVSGFQTGLDLQREDFCDGYGSPGGTAGGVGGALFNVAEGACYDPTTFGHADPYAEAYASWLACQDSLTPNRGRGGGQLHVAPLVIFGVVIAWEAVAQGLVAVGIIAAAGSAIYIHEDGQQTAEDQAYQNARTATQGAYDDWEEIEQDLTTAEGELDTANGNLTSAEDELAEANQSGDSARVETATRDVETKKAAVKTAKEKVEQETEALKAAAANLRKKEDEEANKKRQAEAADDALASTDECGEYQENVFAGTQWERDMLAAFDDADPSTGVNPIVSRFAEGSDFGIDGQGMQPCGQDSATTHAPGMTCDDLVLCGPSDFHCSCSAGTANSGVGQMLAGLANTRCAASTMCSDGSTATAGPFGCSCGQSDDDLTDPGSFGLDFSGPTPRFLMGTFSKLDVVNGMKLSTSEAILVGSQRADMDTVGALNTFSP